jgi:hypothetical protein
MTTKRVKLVLPETCHVTHSSPQMVVAIIVVMNSIGSLQATINHGGSHETSTSGVVPNLLEKSPPSVPIIVGGMIATMMGTRMTTLMVVLRQATGKHMQEAKLTRAMLDKGTTIPEIQRHGKDKTQITVALILQTTVRTGLGNTTSKRRPSSHIILTNSHSSLPTSSSTSQGNRVVGRGSLVANVLVDTRQVETSSVQPRPGVPPLAVGDPMASSVVDMRQMYATVIRATSLRKRIYLRSTIT